MKFFDSHIHFFPDKLAPKTLPKLAEISKSPYHTEGTFTDTLKKLHSWDCCGAMAFHIATTAHQQTSVNNFAAETQKNGIYCFGSVFPGAEDISEQLSAIKDLGLHGIKLHPDYQDFFVDSDEARGVYEKAEKLGLPVAFHTGEDPYSPDIVHCAPEKLRKIADEFPRLTIIAAHMGGMNMPKEAAEHLAGCKNVYFDTAFASYFLTSSQLKELIEVYGADKVLFATDCPWSTVPAERDLLLSMGLSETELEKIAFRNAERLFDITL